MWILQYLKLLMDKDNRTILRQDKLFQKIFFECFTNIIIPKQQNHDHIKLKKKMLKMHKYA